MQVEDEAAWEAATSNILEVQAVATEGFLTCHGPRLTDAINAVEAVCRKGLDAAKEAFYADIYNEILDITTYLSNDNPEETEAKKKEALQAIEHLVSRVPTGASLGCLLRLVPQMSEALSTTAKQWKEMLEGINTLVCRGRPSTAAPSPCWT